MSNIQTRLREDGFTVISYGDDHMDVKVDNENHARALVTRMNQLAFLADVQFEAEFTTSLINGEVCLVSISLGHPEYFVNDNYNAFERSMLMKSYERWIQTTPKWRLK